MNKHVLYDTLAYYWIEMYYYLIKNNDNAFRPSSYIILYVECGMVVGTRAYNVGRDGPRVMLRIQFKPMPSVAWAHLLHLFPFASYLL